MSSRIEAEGAALEWRVTPWDEEVFGYPCAEITHFEARDVKAGEEVMAQFDGWAISNAVKFAYGRFESTKTIKAVMANSGFYFAEASYRVCCRKVAKSDEFDRLIMSGPKLVEANDSELEEISEILASEFNFSRIHEDPWVPPEQASQRYRNWVSDLRSQEQEIYAYKVADRVIGLHVQRTTGERVDLTLSGLRQSHSLFGASLWAERMKLNRDAGVREAWTVISAANLPALKLSLHFGFQLEEFLLGFHKRWSSPGDL